MRHESEIIFPATLNFQGALSGICLQRQADRKVEDPVHNAKRLPLQIQIVAFGKIMNATPQNIVFGNNLFDVECVVQTLQSVSRKPVPADALMLPNGYKRMDLAGMTARPGR